MRVLPDELRDKLKEPIGKLITDEKELLKLLKHDKYIVSVGDLVTYTLLDNNIDPIICIVDFIIKRKEYPNDMKEKIKSYGKKHIKIKNSPASISDDLWNAVSYAFKNIDNGPFCIEVDGEEDLASLPAIYMAPRDVTIIYGLPNKGVLVVKPTEANKNKAKEILDKM